MENRVNINFAETSQGAAAIVVGIADKLSEHKRRAWIYQSGKCLFKLRRCQAHLINLNRIYAKIEQIEPEEFPMKIGVVKGRPIEERFYSYYDGPLAPDLFFDVDGFFESAKSCADFSLDMLGSVGALKNPSNSMNATIKDLKRHRHQSDESLVDALQNFWNKGGQLIKDYRDCFTHFAALAGDHWKTAINIKCERGMTHARYFLPDNPRVNKNLLFTFKNHVDSRELCTELTELLSAYVNSALNACASKVQLEHRFSVNIPREYENVSVGTW